MPDAQARPARRWSSPRCRRSSLDSCREVRGAEVPRSRTTSTAVSMRVASSGRSSPSAQQHRGAEDGGERVGDALAGDVGRRAVDRLVEAAARGPAVAEASADGSIPIEPASIEASSVRMSPNMFSVTITSKSAGGGRGASRRVDQRRPDARRRGTRRATSCATSRQSRDDSSTLALSTEVSRLRGAGARGAKAARTMRSISSAV